MTKPFPIAIEPLSEDTFAPFGAIIGPSSTPPIFRNAKLHAWRMAYESNGPSELMFDRYFHQPLRFSTLERHFAVTQCFIPLGHVPTVMVVAAPTDPSDRRAIPPPEALRAFLFDVDYGLMLWRGTWHALDRFPVNPPHADFALLTCENTQRELEKEKRDGSRPTLTQVVDYATLEEIHFTIEDPAGLVPPA
jgi:ureidoglycolate lyase